MKQDQLKALRALEASVLGAILCRPETLTEMPELEVADFHHPAHRDVFTAMRNLEAASLPIDAVTVQAQLARETTRTGHERREADDFAFLGDLSLSFPTAENVADYVRQIRSAALGRRVRTALVEVLDRAATQELVGEELLSMALGALTKLDDVIPDQTAAISRVLRDRFRQLEQIAEERRLGQRTLTGFPTGVGGLDEKIGGWQPGIVTIVAARPGMGKSSLGLATADACSAAGYGVHLFTLEDTKEAYADRAIARGSGVPAETLRMAEFNRGQLDAIARAHAALRGRRWLIDEHSGVSADEIVRSVRRHRKGNETRVVIVDYVQLVRRANPRQSAHEALTEIVTTLADAAKQDRMAYVVMSQLNRGVEQRQDKRPQLSDLRESGSLEERAKCVVGLYRGAYYGDPVKGIDWDPDWAGHNRAPSDHEHAAQVQLHVLKNSNGRTGTVFARWNGPTTCIS